AEPRLQHLDVAALRGDLEALRGHVRHGADLAAHVREAPEEDLLRIEDLQRLAAGGGPGARRRVAAADQVVDVVDRLRPVDARFRGAAPALVARVRLVLRGLLMTA